MCRRPAWLRVLVVCSFGITAAVASTVATAMAQTTAIPSSPAGRRAAALAALLTGPSAPAADAVRAFVEANYAASALTERSATERTERFARPFADAAGGELVLVAPESDTAIALTLKNRAQPPIWITFRLEVEPAPPHGIRGIGIQAEDSPPSPAASGPPISAEEAWKLLAAEVDERMRADRFAGVVLVAREGQPQFSRAAGLAERAFAAPIRLDTKFNLGSINKIFTELVIRHLEAEGKLTLDDPLARHLPDYPDGDVARQVTLRQMLEHRSGLGDFFGERFDSTPPTVFRKLSDYLPMIVGQPLRFPPGTSQSYSNAGYLLLGLVIEKLTGQTYYDAVRQRIFVPAGMTDTASYAGDEIVPNRATGYTRGGPDGDALRSNIHLRPARGSSAGGGYSTAPDLLRFEQALKAGKIGPNDAFRRRGGPGIAGGSDGVNAVLNANWQTGWTTIVLANLDPPSAENLAGFIRGLLGRIRQP